MVNLLTDLVLPNETVLHSEKYSKSTRSPIILIQNLSRNYTRWHPRDAGSVEWSEWGPAFACSRGVMDSQDGPNFRSHCLDFLLKLCHRF